MERSKSEYLTNPQCVYVSRMAKTEYLLKTHLIFISGMASTSNRLKGHRESTIRWIVRIFVQLRRIKFFTSMEKFHSTSMERGQHAGPHKMLKNQGPKVVLLPTAWIHYPTILSSTWDGDHKTRLDERSLHQTVTAW